MKKMLGIFGIAAAVFAITVGAASAQAPKRIVFEKGKSSAVVTGTSARYGDTYVVRARSGQKLVLDLKPGSGAGIKVETNGRFGQTVLLREEHGGRFEVGLEEAGDYTIFIGPLGRNPVTYTLKVTITKLADI